MLASHRPVRSTVHSAVAVVALGLSAVVAHAQSRPPQQPDPTAIGGSGSRIYNGITAPSNMEVGGDGAGMRARLENTRKVQRLERLTASANRLLDLTRQFQAEVAAHPEMTADDARRLDDIAKLAREVKAHMLQ